MSDSKFQGIEVYRGTVLPDWIDVNGHMNVAHYMAAFDLAVESLWEQFGITENQTIIGNSSTFAVESHITWQRELLLDEPYFITAHLLAYDNKRIHQFMRMYHAEKYFLASTAEWLNLHVDIDVRKVSPWPDAMRSRIAAFAERQGNWKWPAEVGKQMHIQNPVYSAATND